MTPEIQELNDRMLDRTLAMEARISDLQRRLSKAQAHLQRFYNATKDVKRNEDDQYVFAERDADALGCAMDMYQKFYLGER